MSENYSSAVRSEASRRFDSCFNCISFEMLKKAIGEDTIIDYIGQPSQKIKEEEAKNNYTDEEWQEMSQDKKEEAIDEAFQEHYPMWGTVFEAKDNFLSEKIMADIDKLYDLGIGVIAPSDDVNACLFIAGCGYDFFDAHWIPLFIHWGYLNIEEIEKEEERKSLIGNTSLIDWVQFSSILQGLSENKDETIKRHSLGLLKALKL